MYLITPLVNVKNVRQSDIRKYYLYSFHWSTSSPSPFEAASFILRRHIISWSTSSQLSCQSFSYKTVI